MKPQIVFINEHKQDCKGLQFVKEKSAPTPWHIMFASVGVFTHDGMHMQSERPFEDQYQRFLEFRCFDQNCRAIKRVSMIDISNL